MTQRLCSKNLWSSMDLAMKQGAIHWVASPFWHSQQDHSAFLHQHFFKWHTQYFVGAYEQKWGSKTKRRGPVPHDLWLLDSRLGPSAWWWQVCLHLFLTSKFSSFFREACIVFKPGKNHDGWFSANDLLNQVECAIDIFEGLTKGWAQGLFLFDNAPSHQKHAENALSACWMPKGAYSHPSQLARHSILSGPKRGWTRFQGSTHMCNSWFPNNKPQLFYFPDDHPTMPGWFKGMHQQIW